jgi:hypothetical protein
LKKSSLRAYHRFIRIKGTPREIALGFSTLGLDNVMVEIAINYRAIFYTQGGIECMQTVQALESMAGDD